MSIKIKKDGQVREFILPATNIQVLDMADKFKKKDLENVIKEISDTEHIYIGEVDETKDGIWIDDGEILDNEENNGVVERIKEYVDDEIKDYSNPNLLVNGDFQIWSRGNNLNDFFQKEQFSADKWICANNDGNVFTVSKSKYGITFNSENESSQSQRFRFHQNIEGAKRLNGKTLTFSFKVRDSIDRKLIFAGGKNTVLDDTILVSQVITVKNGINTITFDIPNDTFNDVDELQIGFAFCCGDSFPYWGCSENIKYQAGSITFEWIKLEIGDKATPFIPKKYSEELLNCNDGIIGSNPNLLINGDFSVWQRGTNFNISNDGTYNYTSDRWIVQTDSTSITATSLPNNGMRVDMQRFSGTYLNVMQLLEIPYYKKLVGKDVTIRVKFKNNVSDIRIGVRAFPDTSATHILMPETKNEFTITTQIPKCSTDCTKFMIYVQSRTKQILDFDYIKVELGLTATPFVPRNYGEELALCQRYYQAQQILATPFRYGTNFIACTISLPVSMRTTPSLKGDITKWRIYNSNAVEQTGFSSPTVTSLCQGCLNIQFVKNAHGLSITSGIYATTSGVGIDA